MQKVISSMMTQLRIKITLKDLLYLYRIINTPKCLYGEGDQIRNYILKNCFLFEKEKWAIWDDHNIIIKEIFIKLEEAIKAARFMI